MTKRKTEWTWPKVDQEMAKGLGLKLIPPKDGLNAREKAIFGIEPEGERTPVMSKAIRGQVLKSGKVKIGLACGHTLTVDASDSEGCTLGRVVRCAACEDEL